MINKICKCFLILGFASLSYGQDLVGDFDEQFLNSLPDEVRDDLLKETAKKKESEEPNYRNQPSYIEKPENKKSNKTLYEYYKQLIEDESKAEKRFGSEIFSMMQTSLMPTNEPNFDSSYILDFGDVLEIQFFGQKSVDQISPIKRDGSIYVEDIGKIFVAGLSLENALELITNRVNSAFIGVDVFVTLTSVRDVQVIIAGEAYNPGPYTLNGNSNIFHALVVSGGPSNEGSFRKINLVRNNEVIETVDLYETFVSGKSTPNLRLRSGDLIFVEPTLNLVSVSGAVNRPAIYELKDDESLSTLIKFANGINNKSDLSNINLFRLINGGIETVKIKDLAELENITSRDNDKLVIREYRYRKVTIEGAVINPGTYIMNEGEGIYELINRAGGYSNNAYPYGGILENESTRKINKMAVDDLYKSFINTLASSFIGNPAGGDISNLANLMLEIKNSPVSARVSAEFNLDVLRQDKSLDVKLQDKDRILIPEFLDQVYIFGEVSNEGTIRYKDDEDASYYINKKGGYNKFADQKEVYILFPDGEVVRVGSKNVFMQNKKKYNIHPGSIIFVPRKTDNPLIASQIAQAYATILGNIGVTITSLSILNDRNSD